MILLVPRCGDLDPADSRLIRLAEFLGIRHKVLELRRPVGCSGRYLAEAAPPEDSCLIVNPLVLSRWTDTDTIPENLASSLSASFRHLFVHSLRVDPFDIDVVQTLSNRELQGIRDIEPGSSYSVASESGDICGAYAGLRFGPSNPSSDLGLFASGQNKKCRNLIQIGNLAFMITCEQERCKTWFIAGREIAQLDVEIGESPVLSFFSRLMPYAMALRSIFGEECWQPAAHYATLVIDDPLLRPSYGALDFEALLGSMRRYTFHSTLAFIPRNFKRSSAKTAHLFRSHPEYFSLCYHGNDHLGGEFASNEQQMLNTLVGTAQQRMRRHHDLTGLACDRIMVFPQGKFSLEAMKALKSHNFDGAINTTPHPMGEPSRLTLAEAAQPAVVRYGDFPLFLRKYSRDTTNEEIAFNVFFGKPTLIVEHHDVFERPELLFDAVGRINHRVPSVRWLSVGNVLRRAVLRRRSFDGAKHIRAYSRTVRILNESDTTEACSVEWLRKPELARDSNEQITLDDTPISIARNPGGVSLELAGGGSVTIALRQIGEPEELRRLGLGYNARAFIRRRLSEMRDNYLTGSPKILATAKFVLRGVNGTMQRH